MAKTPVIGLLGATGYTGELTTAELIRRGIPHVLGGRSKAKLDALPGDGERRVIDTGSPESLAVFMHGLDAVISCIGPFSLYGDPVVDAAVRAGVPYVDSTGELEYMLGVYSRHAKATTPIVPACGFDVVPGDMVADLACSALEKDGAVVGEVVISYDMHGTAPSRGTARTALNSATKASWVPARVQHKGPHGPRSLSSAPFSESTTVQLHRPHVDAVVGIKVPKAIHTALPVLGLGIRGLRPVMRLAAPVINKRVIDKMSDGPDPDKRNDHKFSIVAEARSIDGQLRQAVVTGQSPYDLTALCLVEAARRTSLPVSPVGPLSPSMAFDSADFLDFAGLSWFVA